MSKHATEECPLVLCRKIAVLQSKIRKKSAIGNISAHSSFLFPLAGPQGRGRGESSRLTTLSYPSQESHAPLLPLPYRPCRHTDWTLNILKCFKHPLWFEPRPWPEVNLLVLDYTHQWGKLLTWQSPLQQCAASYTFVPNVDRNNKSHTGSQTTPKWIQYWPQRFKDISQAAPSDWLCSFLMMSSSLSPFIGWHDNPGSCLFVSKPRPPWCPERHVTYGEAATFFYTDQAITCIWWWWSSVLHKIITWLLSFTNKTKLQHNNITLFNIT